MSWLGTGVLWVGTVAFDLRDLRFLQCCWWLGTGGHLGWVPRLPLEKLCNLLSFRIGPLIRESRFGIQQALGHLSNLREQISRRNKITYLCSCNPLSSTLSQVCTWPTAIPKSSFLGHETVRFYHSTFHSFGFCLQSRWYSSKWQHKRHSTKFDSCLSFCWRDSSLHKWRTPSSRGTKYASWFCGLGLLECAATVACPNCQVEQGRKVGSNAPHKCL